jgi:hypothetical protein
MPDPVPREETPTGLIHPEWVGGRRLWVDTLLIDKLHYGDPVRGWEGDLRLAVYWNEPELRWELWRLEADGEYRIIARSLPGIPFDERVIDSLIAWDRRRRPVSLHDEIATTNERRDAEIEQRHQDWLTEEVTPRLRRAVGRES